MDENKTPDTVAGTRDAQDSEATAFLTDPEAVPPDGALAIELRFGAGRFHARGGLGAVFVARDLHLHREVALKFIRGAAARDAESRVQFLREAEITAGLEHPGVVPVHGSGTAPDGTPFYAMRFIQGETLDAAVRRFHERGGGERLFLDHAVEFRGLLARFLAVCNTVAYAHNRGIIHRDIKPENVMLGKYGETLLVDWGLALPVGRDDRARASGEVTLRPQSGSGQSSTGSGGGTPAYMSPEQADAAPDITVASDVYSLGATLYKVLTGEPAFSTRGGNLREALERVKRGEFRPPGQVTPGVPRALEAVCLKAMAMNPRDRYPSALALAEDVEHWLADEPVTACREGGRQRLARWARRHRTGVLAGAGSLVAVMLIAVVAAVWLGRQANRERAAREQGLRLSAKFAARTVANEIDLRWRILESEATSAELRTQLARVNEAVKEAKAKDEKTRDEKVKIDPAVLAPLQAWLDARYIKYNATTHASGWFIDDRGGTLVALSTARPERHAQYIGRSFATRDFFHGKGKELTEKEAAEAGPLREPYLSATFLSKSDGTLKVAFCVPVWGEKEADGLLGVLAMTVDLGQFVSLVTELEHDQLAVLVDTRPDHVEKDERRGLVLHHPWLAEGRLEGVAPQDLLRRLGGAALARMNNLRADRLRREDIAARGGRPDAAPPLDSLDRDYADPVGGKYAGRWVAAAEPVVVKGRPEALRDSGWVVVVQERR